MSRPIQPLSRRALIGTFVVMSLALSGCSAPQPPLVLAPASLQESMTAAADAWAALGHPRPVLSFAASSSLARQIVAGAPADLFVSADLPWMDTVERAGRLAPGSRAVLLGNRLVLVAAAADRRSVPLNNAAPLLEALGGERLAMADPDVVPAGIYGKAALQAIGAWERIAPRLARAENVRAALAMVERGGAPFGIVYATDARASARVRVVGSFPENSHPAIQYPVARLAGAASLDAEPFRQFLLSPAGKAIFARYGFTPQ
ncbi:molybdate ABC transporter substrate-binding protein [Sphingomonas sp. HT-1]|uniref:molybdate ABC transporter substrate-binding protein n=1 Tax=unclassified Sphingomonas TaxID=196159 RepID=UPI00031E8C5C|nr:molybdenum ABC transporter substrate-binding protein [Sphingomonas sp. WG]